MKYLRLLLFTGFALLLLKPAHAQVPPSTEQELTVSIQKRDILRQQSVFHSYPLRNVGPVIMSGRVADIAVHPGNSRIFYVGYASGGVFKTTNSGNTMEPVFDHQGALGVGDLALAPSNPDIIWVGTGENNSSRSSYAGAGMYKSEDGGKSWIFAGLRNSQHIGRVVIHPEDPNTVWVASIGALYSKNDDRGIFKTTDGGKTWEKTLFVNDSTGVIDLLMHPDNPDILWASSWERSRKAWDFKEGGEGSAVYKSTDGGKNWSRIANGLPRGKHVGRIGLDVSRSNPDIVYAVIDNQFETKEEVERQEDILTQASFVDMSKDEFLELDNKKLNNYLRRGGFPEKYDAGQIKKDIREGEYEVKALAEYLGDANQALFDTDIIGAEVYRSEDGGESWNKVNSYDLDFVYNTYGYYFGEIRVDPTDPDVVYVFGVPFLKSTDGGKTWTPKAENQPVHVDHHAMWIDPNDPEHILLGNDGGLYESHDGGDNFIHHNVAPVGQFYTVNVDMEEPYNIYGGLQDNGTFYGSSKSVPNEGEPWKRLFGGDGMHVAPDNRDPSTVYVGFQYGNYFRIDTDGGAPKRITPKHEVGEPRYRYNWNTPINLSHHNQDIIYFGSQKLNRSMDRGNSWTPISPDLTHDLPNGDVPYSTITTIAESPLNFNTIWVGTDDGKIQLSRDAGTSWQEVSGDLPQRLWVSEVHASVHDEATAYVTLNGYRYDDFTTYIYKTDDFGQTWKSIKGNLPNEVANVVHQDPEIPEIVYAGLDHGTYISFNDGGKWHYLNTLPNVASYDLLVHPRELELVIGTHGRSIWVMDVKPLHKVSSRLEQHITAFKPDDIRFSERWGQQRVQYREPFMPEVKLLYYLGTKESNQEVEIAVTDKDGVQQTVLTTTGDYGFNTMKWDLVTGHNEDGEPAFLQKGTYTLTFKSANTTDEVEFTIK